MVEQRNLGLASSHEHSESTTTYRDTLSEDNPKTSRKDFPQSKIKIKSHTEIGRRSRVSSWLGLTPMGRGIQQLPRSPLRSKVSELHIRLPSQGSLHWEYEPQ